MTMSADKSACSATQAPLTNPRTLIVTLDDRPHPTARYLISASGRNLELSFTTLYNNVHKALDFKLGGMFYFSLIDSH